MVRTHQQGFEWHCKGCWGFSWGLVCSKANCTLAWEGHSAASAGWSWKGCRGLHNGLLEGALVSVTELMDCPISKSFSSCTCAEVCQHCGFESVCWGEEFSSHWKPRNSWPGKTWNGLCVELQEKLQDCVWYIPVILVCPLVVENRACCWLGV